MIPDEERSADDQTRGIRMGATERQENGRPVGPARRIGSYAIERKLGEGGMGTVFLARSRGGRAVAVKVARAELAADPEFRARFRAEVAAARAVGGFHTAQVVDADPEADPPWLATAYVPGPTLAEHIAARGAMAPHELRTLGAALAEAVAAIHGCGLVHRDLKPGNIVMAADGPRVLDFGIARAVESTRLTATGRAFGTPGFLAPEQAVGADVTGAADMFALGAVLVAAAGGSAFGTGTPMGVMYRTVHEPADLSAVPEAMRRVVAACLDKEPARRPTPAQLLDHFDTAAAGAQAAGATAPTSYRLAPPSPPVGRPQGPPGRPYPPPPRPPRAPARTVVDRSAGRAVAASHREFVASDKDTGIVVDADGVLLALAGRGLSGQPAGSGAGPGSGGTEIELTWAEIVQVSHLVVHRTRLHVAVTLRDGSVHEIEIRARRAGRVQEWQQGLARVVARYLPDR